MLLGIVLHASLSFFPAPWWPVQDSRQSEYFGLLHEAIHGFRMPLFFLISGFFTMMLYRKRGLKSLLANRAMRILVPCVIGVFTIVPILRITYTIVNLSGASVQRIDKSSLAGAIRARDVARVREAVSNKEDLNAPDNALKVTPLHWAMLMGDKEAFDLLVDGGADVDKPNADGSSPLHTAAFIGRDDFAAKLLEKGANPSVTNGTGETALASTKVPMDTTIWLLGYLSVPVPDVAKLEAGRKLVHKRLEPLVVVSAPVTVAPPSPDARAMYQKLIGSKYLALGPIHLVQTNFFDHLWFLWLLCWMVAGFALCVTIGNYIRLPFALPVVSEFRFLWLVPLSMIPQWFMGIAAPHLGPDTSLGLLPLPHVLAYYAVFFGFGALYYDAGDDSMRVARGWWLYLLIGFGVLLWIALSTYQYPLVNGLIQVLYAWCVSFGMMGLFHAVCRKESPTMRYLSDASYWMYVIHLPLIVVLQALIRDWDMNPFVKFLLVNIVGTLILVASYQLLVRHTLIGVLLNGSRPTPTPPPKPATDQPAWGNPATE
jgi:peptidoglycan/LPS O-acetylase OafA/YrhL